MTKSIHLNEDLELPLDPVEKSIPMGERKTDTVQELYNDINLSKDKVEVILDEPEEKEVKDNFIFETSYIDEEGKTVKVSIDNLLF